MQRVEKSLAQAAPLNTVPGLGVLTMRIRLLGTSHFGSLLWKGLVSLLCSVGFRVQS